MSQDILINWSPQETRVAVVEHGAAQEVHIERALERGLVGNVYLGKVARVLPGMQSAFIDIGFERAAFLHVADLLPNINARFAAKERPPALASPPAHGAESYLGAPVPEQPGAVPAASHLAPIAFNPQDAENPANTGGVDRPKNATPVPAAPVPGAAQVPVANGQAAASALPIERQLYEGQALLVQVLKDPIGSKGARLTAQISIAGRQLVFLPQDQHLGVSQKIPPAQREALRQRLQALTAGEGGGFILRTNAEDASDDELAEDVAYLRKSWAHIKRAAALLPAPSLLQQDLSLLQRVLRDLASIQTKTIQVDSLEQFGQLQQFAREYMPAMLERIVHYRGERPIFDLYQIDEEIARALGRRVELKSGGYLVIDQTEALTTIDVNTGGFVGARNFDDTIFRTNLEATQVIARQLRLRNLGGIVIVDFIDMLREAHREAVLAELRKQLARDRVKTTTGTFSQLGLLEMTRKRNRESLAQLLSQTCPTCSGSGRVKTARSVCYDILREILREARAFSPREFRIVAAAPVIELLLDEESAHLAGLSEFIGKPISLQSEAALRPDQYDIVLL